MRDDETIVASAQGRGNRQQAEVHACAGDSGRVEIGGGRKEKDRERERERQSTDVWVYRNQLHGSLSHDAFTERNREK